MQNVWGMENRNFSPTHRLLLTEELDHGMFGRQFL